MYASPKTPGVFSHRISYHVKRQRKGLRGIRAKVKVGKAGMLKKPETLLPVLQREPQPSSRHDEQKYIPEGEDSTTGLSAHTR